MEYSRNAVVVAIGLIIGFTLISGPLVESVDISGHSRDIYCEPSGIADVNVKGAESQEYVLSPRVDNNKYYSVTGPPVSILIDKIQGCPVLTLVMEIPALGFKSVRKSFLRPGDGPQVSLSIVGGYFASNRINDESYEGTVTLWLNGTENRTLYTERITIEVSNDS